MYIRIRFPVLHKYYFKKFDKLWYSFVIWALVSCPLTIFCHMPYLRYTLHWKHTHFLVRILILCDLGNRVFYYFTTTGVKVLLLIYLEIMSVLHFVFQTADNPFSLAHRPGSFARIRPLSAFDRFDITNIYLKPHNRPIFGKSTPTADPGLICAPKRQNRGQKCQSLILSLKVH